MKYLKTMNELFDSDELKDQMEIPMLQGKIPFKDIVKDKNIIKQADPLLANLTMSCPFLGNLKYRRVGNILSIGFDERLNFGEGNDVSLHFYIEICEHQTTKRYICNIYAKCVGNGQTLYDERVNKPIMTFESLRELLNRDALNLLIDFTRYTEKVFNYKFFPFTKREDVHRNLMFN